MAIKITGVVTNITYDYDRVVDGHSRTSIRLTFTGESDIAPSYYLVKCGAYISPKWKYPTDGTDLIYPDHLVTEDYYFIEVYSADDELITKDQIPVYKYGYYTPEIFAWVNNIDTGAGEINIGCQGIFWMGNFSKGSTLTANTLTVNWYYRRKGATNLPWSSIGWKRQILTEADVNPEGGGVWSTSFTDMNFYEYPNQYEIKLEAIDGITTTEFILDLLSDPIFDWSQSDFKFNVPMQAVKGMSIGPYNSITQKRANSDEEIEIIKMEAEGQTGLLINRGSQDTDYDTLIYGHNIVLMPDNNVYIGSTPIGGATFTGAFNALTQAYNLTATITANPSTDNYFSFTNGNLTNYTSCTATLRGNCLYVRYYCNYSSYLQQNTANTGQLTPVFLGCVTLEHGGKITGADYVYAACETVPGCVRTVMPDTQEETTLTFDVSLENVANTTSAVSATFVIPVSLDLSKF